MFMQSDKLKQPQYFRFPNRWMAPRCWLDNPSTVGVLQTWFLLHTRRRKLQASYQHCTEMSTEITRDSFEREWVAHAWSTITSPITAFWLHDITVLQRNETVDRSATLRGCVSLIEPGRPRMWPKININFIRSTCGRPRMWPAHSNSYTDLFTYAFDVTAAAPNVRAVLWLHPSGTQ